ncbi:hypothetical protein CANCADRAFT_24445 [Tortispora caseinolytica NRRL Y-17796]|uniref:Large ribosomal subunit protein mL53 n=1 Tax=Tortispora caseinolytica NRRL Y-17796 TaxID=767744 RepID=A0A1E4TEL6_9ASCO|nr:hypothetical protein CANCADRAFT_24445 [Tortispora caseinolytica NRRL Y-17796]
MITKYFSQVTVKFDPFRNSGKAMRLFISQIPASTRQHAKVTYTVLPKGSTEPGLVDITFKDKHRVTLNPDEKTLDEIIANLELHSRQLSLADAMSG